MLRYHCCVAVLLSVLLGVPASARSAPLVTLTPPAQATLAFVFGEPENDDASREDDGDDDDGDEDAEIANDRELPGDDDDDGNDESSEAGDRESECEEEEEEGDGEKEQRTGEGDTDDESERAESDGDSDRENEDGEETGDDSRHEREGREEAGDDDGEDREEGGREQVEDEPEEPGERNDDAAETVRVFTLAHTSSAATARLVQQLYARQRVAVAEDSRTNTVVLRANPRLLDEIEAVIQKVDSARAATSEISAQRQSGDEGALQVKPGAGMSATMALRMREAMNGAGGATLLRQEFQRLDVQSARTAAALRELQTAGGKDGSDSRLANLRQQLVTEISAAFDARQRLHQLELSLLKERVARLQQAVTSREQIREAIIERRAQDLLNPTLLWPPENPASQPVDPGAQTSATAEPAATTPAERERSAASPDSASLRKT
ncbi:MAG: hypothetical protein EHM42_11220, partial [Planctomycetaceae bacterium]